VIFDNDSSRDLRLHLRREPGYIDDFGTSIPGEIPDGARPAAIGCPNDYLGMGHARPVGVPVLKT